MIHQEIEKIIFGTWALGGNNNIEGMSLGWKNLDKKQIKEVLETALSEGIKAYDTSDFYGQGSVEMILGDFFLNARDEVFFATKGGIQPSFTNKYGQLKKDFSVDYIERAFNKSLTSLSTDYIDLYQLHGASHTILENNELLNIFSELKKSKKIKNFGISLGSKNIIENLEKISAYDIVDYVQVSYSLADPRLISSINDWYHQSNSKLKILARSIFYHGLFAKQYPAKIIDQDDHRSRKYDNKLINDVIKFQQLLDSELNMSLLEASLYYAIKSKSINKVILGATEKNQITEWIKILKKFENKDDYSEDILKLAYQCFI